MSGVAIDNTNLTNYRSKGLPVDLFTPVVSYVFDAEAKTVVVTDGSTIPAGDTLKIIHLKVHDHFGGTVTGEITVTGEAGTKTLDVSTLNLSKHLNLTATVLTTNMLAADGGAYHLQAAGNVQNWDKQQNA